MTLLAWYKNEESSGTRNDSSGNGYNLTTTVFSGSDTQIAGLSRSNFQQYASTDGRSSWNNVNAGIVHYYNGAWFNGTSVTVIMCVNGTLWSGVGEECAVLQMGTLKGGSAATLAFQFEWNRNSSFYFMTSDGSSTDDLGGGMTPNINEWNILVGRYNATNKAKNFRIYRVKRGTYLEVSSTASHGNNLNTVVNDANARFALRNMKNHSSGNWQYGYPGAWDDCRIYDSYITDSDLANIIDDIQTGPVAIKMRSS